MKKILSCFLITCILISSVTEVLAANPGYDTFKVNVNLLKVEKPMYNVTINTPYFEGFESADSVNAFIQDKEIDDLAELNTAYEDYLTFVEDLKKQGDTLSSDALGLWGDFSYSRNGCILSLCMCKSCYYGGAHGGAWIDSITANTKTGEVYSNFNSLFKASSGWQKYITDNISKHINADSETYFPDAIETIKKMNGNFNFLIDGSDIVIYFGQYDIACYAAGIRDFTFSAKELKNYLKSEIYESIANAKSSPVVTVDAVPLNLSQPAYMGTDWERYATMAPARDIANALGLNISYNAAKKQATIGTAVIKVGTNSYAASSTEQPVMLETAPRIIKNTLYVPLSFFSEILNYYVIGTNIYTHINTKNNFDYLISDFTYPTSGQECIKMFEQAQKDKNGAVQYALCNKALRTKIRSSLVAADWKANISGSVGATEKVDDTWFIKDLKQEPNNTSESAVFPLINLTVYQNGKETKANNAAEIPLDRSPFSLRFNIKSDGAVQIAALDNQADYDIFTSGISPEDVPYFSPGTGMAASGQYDAMVIDNEAHHYIYYNNDSEDSRAKLLSQYKDGTLYCEWQINGMDIRNKNDYSLTEYSLKDFPQKKVYLVAFTDFDNDNVVDEGEYSKVVLSFK
jgi:hypothetical protein